MNSFLQSVSALALTFATCTAVAQTVPVNPPPTGSGTGSSTGTYSGGTTPTNQPMNPTRTGGDGVYQNGQQPVNGTMQNGSLPPAPAQNGTMQNGTLQPAQPQNGTMQNGTMQTTPPASGTMQTSPAPRKIESSRVGEGAYNMGSSKAREKPNANASDVNLNSQPVPATTRDKSAKEAKKAERRKNK